MPVPSRRFLLACAAALAALAASGRAGAAGPRGTYTWAPPDRVQTGARGAGSNIIYMNRCEGGCTISPGFEDSRTDHSSIVDATSFLDEFPYGDLAWDSVVACVRDMYQPFDVVVTDEDPGSEPHFETIVAGDPEDIGQPTDVGGVAPFNCAVIQNAITYDFANLWPDMRDLCETVAQETAHAFGLDHEHLCPDPMTYLDGCGEKAFRDQDAPCGEYEERPCVCGGDTQNSYALIADTFNSTSTSATAPTVSIASPADAAHVQPGFAIEVAAEDDVAVVSVEAYLDDELLGSDVAPPYRFTAPDRLPIGDMALRVVATDGAGDAATQIIHVVGTTPCSGADPCSDGQVCASSACIAGPDQEGGLGARCDANEDCQTDTCGDDGHDRYCAAPCDDGDCPDGFQCRGGGVAGLCWPADQDPGGGCRAGATGGERGGDGLPGTGPGGTILVIGLLLAGRRRARRRAR